MPLITFISHDGNIQEAMVTAGKSLMQAAVDNGIDGIVAECGGACSCATCHCYVEEAWQAKVGEPGSIEKYMLEHVLESRPNSRLSCQIMLNDEHDGMVVRLPASQY